MKKNRILNIALLICQLIKIIYIVFFVGLSYLFVHLQINPKKYEKIDVKSSVNFKSQISLTYELYANSDGKMPEEPEAYLLNKLSTVSLYKNYMKISAICLLLFLCVSDFQKIIKSVKKTETFKINNTKLFNRIGKKLIMVFVLTIYMSFGFKSGRISSINMNLTFLILALLAFVFAEIFKDGNMLEEENKLTV